VSATVEPLQRVVIQPSRGWRALDFRELWRFRELAYFLALRDIKVRYKQTALGVTWVVLQPLLATGIFSIVFGSRGLAANGVPYPLFVVSGLVPWFYFANATAGASGSIVGNAQLISKVYFPRLAIPLAAVLANLVDFAIGLALVLILLVVYGTPFAASPREPNTIEKMPVASSGCRTTHVTPRAVCL